MLAGIFSKAERQREIEVEEQGIVGYDPSTWSPIEPPKPFPTPKKTSAILDEIDQLVEDIAERAKTADCPE